MGGFMLASNIAGQVAVGVLIVLLILLLVFLIARELVCWYWKVNKIVDLLEKIQRNTAGSARSVGTALRQMPQSANSMKSASSSAMTEVPAPLDPEQEECPFCKEPSLTTNKTCEVCDSQKR